MELTALTSLEEFYFDDTLLCEPDQQSFRDWLATLSIVFRSDLICGATSPLFLPLILF